MDKLGHMRTLVTVAKLGSFSAAAKELGVTPGMVSKQVKQLEDGLDVRLLHRTTRGVSLTDAGELYVGQVLDILLRIDEAETSISALASGPRGVLRISCPPSFGTNVLTAIIAGFARAHPGIRVELGLQDDEPDVIASRLDVIFRLGKLRDSSLVAKQVGNVPFVLCAAPTYLAQAGSPHSAAELADFNCLVDGSIHPDERWAFVCDGRRVEQPVSGSFFSLSTEAVIQAAIEGLGIAYVPLYAVDEELQAGELVALNLAQACAIVLPLFALYGSRDHVAAKIHNFLDFFVAHAGTHAGMQGVGAGGIERRVHPAKRNESAAPTADQRSEDLVV